MTGKVGRVAKVLLGEALRAEVKALNPVFEVEGVLDQIVQPA
ncbi:hypothetical protein [Thauera linaloolentis]|nr:hypothetical protein [Thauera linaloolentis]